MEKRRNPATLLAIGLALAAIFANSHPIFSADDSLDPVGHFEPAAVYHVSGQVAEIVAATPDGMTLVYTDSAQQEIGFVDISDPSAPAEIGKTPVGGEPTSVAVTPDGQWALAVVHGAPDQLLVINASTRVVDTAIMLGGQPDSIAVSPDGRYAAIAVENERDETVNGGRMPQSPAGFVTIVDIIGAPAAWQTRDVPLAGLPGARFPTDPEPEFVDIDPTNRAAVTLQENNYVVVIDLPSGDVIENWSAGTVTHAADLIKDGVVSFTDVLSNAPREPDGIAWTPNGRLVTSNEGDYAVDLLPGQFVGGRGFTIFSAGGDALFDPGADLEMEAARQAVYDDNRSDKKGCEIEGAEVGIYHNHTYIFVGSERCNFVAVYRINGDSISPKFIQLLKTGAAPEGLVAIGQRALFVSANEGDGTISIFVGRPGNPN